MGGFGVGGPGQGRGRGVGRVYWSPEKIGHALGYCEVGVAGEPEEVYQVGLMFANFIALV